MIGITEPIIVETIEEVKGSKYAVLYDKRSRNNWYKGKNDRIQKLRQRIQDIDGLPRS